MRDAAWREEAAARQAAWEATAQAGGRGRVLLYVSGEAREREDAAAAEIIKLQRRLLEGAEAPAASTPLLRNNRDSGELGKLPVLRQGKGLGPCDDLH